MRAQSASFTLTKSCESLVSPWVGGSEWIVKVLRYPVAIPGRSHQSEQTWAENHIKGCIISSGKLPVVCVHINQPAMMKMTPAPRATLSFCSSWSAIQVVHLMPTTATRMEIKHSRMAHSISPRVPCTIPGGRQEDVSHTSPNHIWPSHILLSWWTLGVLPCTQMMWVLGILPPL